MKFQIILSETTLESVRNYLIDKEDIPNNLSGLKFPESNPEFQFTDELLLDAINGHDRWAATNDQPLAFYDKPENYIGLDEFEDILNISKIGKGAAIDLLNLASLKSPQEIENALSSFEMNDLNDILIRLVDSSRNSKQIEFSQENIKGSEHLLEVNPGSSILNNIEAILQDTDSSNETIANLYNQQVKPLWDWVEKNKGAEGVNLSKFLTFSIIMSKGNIAEGLWNATVMLKLRARNNHQTLEYNDVKNTDEIARVRAENNDFLTGIKDPFSPRLNARWVLDDVPDKELFAHDYKKKLPLILKHLDSYAAAGVFYHDLDIAALCGSFDPRIVQLMVVLKHFLSDGKIGIKKDYGIEKIAADLMVASRATQIDKILESRKIN